jgi:hypothetical protein
VTNTNARDLLESSVRRELFGPEEGEAPRGRPLDCSSGAVNFDCKEDSWGIWHESTTGEEVLTESDPLRRYGVGVLHGGGTTQTRRKAGPVDLNPEDISWVTGLGGGESDEGWPVDGVIGRLHHDQADADDFDLSDANTFKPSAMAISFKCRIQDGGCLDIHFEGAYYDRITASVPQNKSPREWWVRRPINVVGQLRAEEISREIGRLYRIDAVSADGQNLRLTPSIQVYCRNMPAESDQNISLVTVAVINQSTGVGSSNTLFQSRFEVMAEGGIAIEPYPESQAVFESEEEESLELLFRNKRTYAIGHGCAADWDFGPNELANCVRAVPMPAYEVMSLTPDIFVDSPNGNRRSVVVSMYELSQGSVEGNEQVESVMRLYGNWIDEQERLISSLVLRLQKPALRHVELCRIALARMRNGWDLVSKDSISSSAFKLMNRAMLEQQIRSRLPLREVTFDDGGILKIEDPYPTLDTRIENRHWRPFQIAFLLATLPELVDRRSMNREIVDLIFFPTGGGKTEAYLGASALSLLARRLRLKTDFGTDILMRYTLRLLTAQQFLRAASLICVLETIRSEMPDQLGSDPFGIGVWLGGSSTPNTWLQAVNSLQKLARDENAENPFLLLRCPWCGTQMGVRSRGQRTRIVSGYERVGQKVVLRCPDYRCTFGGRGSLPIHVVDEDIYDVRPSIVIGTVDKFAMLAWRPSARRLFGLGDDGQREVSPPGLIVQDELHLISGPLGSMVGLYEPVIESLCTDVRGERPVKPKVIASTATVRRYEEQILSLFGRREVALFPPHGLEDGHSFFAEILTNGDGKPLPGRRYLGVFSASLGSTQTVQVRVTAATLQGALNLPEADRDLYWTNLNFFNSLRELGNTVSLLESDVPDYLTGLRRRESYDEIRWPKIKMELTSRRRSDDIPKAIDQLQLRYGEVGAVDICLASNIIEVGVDIERLGLMTIIGQPKTTAQYIQVSGRVGRRADINPGLVITIYGAAKPRDRSHYERFRSYHETLYAQVEPTSVTPFAAPVLRRALHAVAVSHLRQTAPYVSPYPFPQVLFREAVSILRTRAEMVDPAELAELDNAARSREHEWESWERTEWDANDIGGNPSQGLMRYSGTAPDLESRSLVWDVPSSMRNVDAECRIKISLDYNRVDGDQSDEET